MVAYIKCEEAISRACIPRDIMEKIGLTVGCFVPCPSKSLKQSHRLDGRHDHGPSATMLRPPCEERRRPIQVYQYCCHNTKRYAKPAISDMVCKQHG